MTKNMKYTWLAPLLPKLIVLLQEHEPESLERMDVEG
jgi:hypothetical protein